MTLLEARQARLRLRGRRATQRVPGRDGREVGQRPHRLLPRPRRRCPTTSTASTREMCGRGRRHREDRGHARGRSPTWAACWPSPRACRDDGGTPLIAIAMGPLGIAHAHRWRAATARPSPTPSRGARARRPRPASSRRDSMADLYRVRDVTPATKVYGVLGSRRRCAASRPSCTTGPSRRAASTPSTCPCRRRPSTPFMEALPALGPVRLQRHPALQGRRSCRYLQEVEEPPRSAAASTRWSSTTGMLRGSTTDGTGVLAPLKKRIDVKGQERGDPGRGRRGPGGGPGPACARARASRCSPATRPRRPRWRPRVGCASRRPGRAAGAAPGTSSSTPRRWARAHAPDETPVPAELHRPGTVVFDMVYDPLETRLLREAQAAGCTIDRRPRDAAGPGRGAVRDLDRARGAASTS